MKQFSKWLALSLLLSLPGLPPMPTPPTPTPRQQQLAAARAHPGPHVPPKGAVALATPNAPAVPPPPATNTITVGGPLLVVWQPVENAGAYVVTIGTNVYVSLTNGIALTNRPPFTLSVSASGLRVRSPASVLNVGDISMGLTNMVPEVIWAGTGSNTYTLLTCIALNGKWTPVLSVTNANGIVRVSGALKPGYYRTKTQ